MGVERLLTIADLAERWGVKPSTATALVRGRQVPFVSLRTTGRGGRGPQAIRFRLDAIERWERAQECTWGEIPAEADGADEGSLAELGWDGVIR